MTRLTPHQEKALNYSRHISLTANAGSGKTFVLTRRFLDIVIHENISLRNIAAITFTNLAASELYNEIARSVDDRLATETDEELRYRLEDIRKQMVSASICTIHSFCADILREFPVEAGIDPGFSTLDEYSEGSLIAECVIQVLNDINLKAPAGFLSRAFNGVERLRDSLISLIRNRELLASINADYYSADDESLLILLSTLYKDTILQLYNLFFDGFISAISAAQSAAKKDSDIFKAVAALLDAASATNDPFIKIHQAAKIPAIILTKGGDFYAKYIPKPQQGHLEPELEQISKYRNVFETAAEAFNSSGDLLIDSFQAMLPIIKKLILLYNAALSAYSRKKLQKGALDFTDMLLLVRDILSQEAVRQALAERFRYIMVDEYQDTNELQYEIFLPLLDELRRGNLFVVGDEKQSIYSFRNSEVEIFARTARDIQHAAPQGESLSLPDSFRMAPGLCLFVNTLFEKLFESPTQIFNEVAHEETICAKDTGSQGHIEFLIANRASDELLSETQLVISRILELKAADPSLHWGDFAVLSRYKEIFEEYRKQMPLHNIPFTITGGRGFFQAQCVYDMANYLHFLIAPDNDAALTGILRSPFFMLSDVDLFNIRQTGRGAIFNCIRQYALMHPEKTNICSAVKLLDEHLAFASVHQITEIINRVYDDTPYIAIITNRTDADQVMANIKKLIGIAREFEKEGFRVLFDFVDYLKNATTEIENESFAAVNTAEDSVHLMSIHASKGLQFKIVFLVETNRSFFKAGGFESQVIIDKKFGLLFSLPGGPDFFSERVQPPLVRLAKFIRRQKTLAEEKRLLYVALTRAKEQIFIAASVNDALSATTNSFYSLITSVTGLPVTGGCLTMSGQIKRLVPLEDGYDNITQMLEINIPVTGSIDDRLTGIIAVNKEKPARHFFFAEMPLSGTQQILSATQFASFSQCPMKYFLIYRARLNELFPLPNDYAYTREDEEVDNLEDLRAVKAPALRGRIIHKLLETGCPANTAAERISDLAVKYFPESAAKLADFTAEIEKTYTNFITSDAYTRLAAYSGAKREYDILAAENGFSLYGILDFLYIENDRAVIADYKSDTKCPSDEKISAYSRQLMFYAYAVSKKYPSCNNFEARLLFISFPDSCAVYNWNREELLDVGRELCLMHSSVTTNNYEKKISGCAQCVFADADKNCVVRK